MKYLLIVVMLFGFLLAEEAIEDSISLCDTPFVYGISDSAHMITWDELENLIEFDEIEIHISVDGNNIVTIMKEDAERMTDDEFENFIFLYLLLSNLGYSSGYTIFDREYNYEDNNIYYSACKKLLPDWILERN